MTLFDAIDSESVQDSRGRSFVRNFAVALVLALMAGLLTILVDFNPPDADIKYDWLSAWGAIYSNAHADGLLLADEAGVSIAVNAPAGSEPPFRHPRTPGAVLFQLPLLLIPFDFLFAFSAAMLVFLTAGMVLHVTRRWTVGRTVLALALVAITDVFVVSFRFAGQSGIVAVLTLGAWVMHQRRQNAIAGAALALAGTLKLFPIVLLVPMSLSRRYAAIGQTVAWLLVLNITGLLLPGVNLSDTIEALSGATGLWINLQSNASLVRLLSSMGLSDGAAQLLAAAAIATLMAWLLRRDAGRMKEDPLPWLLGALLVVPLSWIGYDLVLIPVALVLIGAKLAKVRWNGLVVWALWIGPVVGLVIKVGEVGYLGLSARFLMFAAWSAGWLVWDRQNELWSTVGSTLPISGLPHTRAPDGATP